MATEGNSGNTGLIVTPAIQSLTDHLRDFLTSCSKTCVMMISITSFILDLSLWAYVFSIIFVFTISFLSFLVKDVPTDEKIELFGCRCHAMIMEKYSVNAK